MTASPRVSVLLPARNAAQWLGAAVGSILAQTLDDLELVVVDDGSTDATPEVLSAVADRRLRVVRRDGGEGVAAALDAGLEHVRAPLVARMDADDLALPGRLARQVPVLERDEGLVALGAQYDEVDAAGTPTGVRSTLPCGSPLVHWRLLLENPLAHPTVVVRRAALEAVGGYRLDRPGAEDHDLWLRLSPLGRLDNLPDSLLRYRRHPGSVTVGATEVGERTTASLVADALAERLHREPPAEAVAVLRGALDPRAAAPGSVVEAVGLLDDLLAASGAADAAVRSDAARRQVRLLRASARAGVLRPALAQLRELRRGELLRAGLGALAR
ncbi:glycosyl transferase family 2 [Motilibacter rhizosphaerae]|uniref:Glycosyl transferase family 2 n=1 Tax=Motilibacter rhizosphaerae TaxID=598652 RepID=A0A4Q7NWJ7_9ACTN|nr:glycosyltransferase [Motilibacter rhizosphaerae]RZS91288.1 glycosyl transferase family 2 [Motilibacter rhizosphaerae]